MFLQEVPLQFKIYHKQTFFFLYLFQVITMLQGSEALEDPDTELKSLLQVDKRLMNCFHVSLCYYIKRYQRVYNLNYK